MKRTLKTTYSYMTSEEGMVGTMTVAVLAVACAAMVIGMMSNPELIEIFAFAG
jgi:hypothetical protein